MSVKENVTRISGMALGAVAACAALAATGCAAAQPASPRTAAITGRLTVSSPASPHQRAEADARAILRAFVPPPGARHLARQPAAARGALDSPAVTFVSGAEVDDTAWWLTPGQPQTLLAWEEAHLPAWFRPSFSGAGFGKQETFGQAWQLPAVPGALPHRYLVVSVAGAGGGLTAIRLDAQVEWQPARPAGEIVPPAAGAVTIALVQAMSPHPPIPAPVTVTSAAVVRKLAALADSLPVSAAPRDVPCPSGPPTAIRLTFRTRAGGTALAVLEPPDGCGAAPFSVGGRQQPPLQVPGSFILSVLKAARLDWKIS